MRITFVVLSIVFGAAAAPVLRTLYSLQSPQTGFTLLIMSAVHPDSRCDVMKRFTFDENSACVLERAANPAAKRLSLDKFTTDTDTSV
jgi:hypothetical protein